MKSIKGPRKISENFFSAPLQRGFSLYAPLFVYSLVGTKVLAYK